MDNGRGLMFDFKQGLQRRFAIIWKNMKKINKYFRNVYKRCYNSPFISWLWPHYLALTKEDKDKHEENLKRECAQIVEMVLNTNVDEAYENIQKLYEEEKNRNKAIEAKCTAFIALNGFIITLLIATLNFISAPRVQGCGYYKCVIGVLVLLGIIYLARSICFALQALQLRKFHRLSYQDVLHPIASYKNSIIVKLSQITIRNYPVTNERGTYLMLAQKCYLRAIIVFWSMVK